MSPRAAWRLELLGFSEVHDYVGGKADWLARGLPTEGVGHPRRAIDLLRDDVLRCAPEDRAGELRERLPASGRGFAYVVSSGGVLLGRLRGSALADADAGAAAEELMENGPSTVRASEPLEALAERMAHANLTTLPVTSPEGVLLGTVFRADVRSELGEA